MQCLLKRVEQTATAIGLRINREKTEYMVVGNSIYEDGTLHLTEGPVA